MPHALTVKSISCLLYHVHMVLHCDVYSTVVNRLISSWKLHFKTVDKRYPIAQHGHIQR